mmetsp:Transcript_37700/g.84280  ORF Transcript_37700/g.84280 Transcript_37700/m.84280 type:complete len:209 (+) Transcript_37700:718-1344(+)
MHATLQNNPPGTTEGEIFSATLSVVGGIGFTVSIPCVCSGANAEDDKIFEAIVATGPRSSRSLGGYATLIATESDFFASCSLFLSLAFIICVCSSNNRTFAVSAFALSTSARQRSSAAFANRSCASAFCLAASTVRLAERRSASNCLVAESSASLRSSLRSSSSCRTACRASSSSDIRSRESASLSTLCLSTLSAACRAASRCARASL